MQEKLRILLHEQYPDFLEQATDTTRNKFDLDLSNSDLKSQLTEATVATKFEDGVLHTSFNVCIIKPVERINFEFAVPKEGEPKC